MVPKHHLTTKPHRVSNIAILVEPFMSVVNSLLALAGNINLEIMNKIQLFLSIFAKDRIQ